MSILLNIIKYFSKFPDRDGVLKNFKRSTGTLEGYDSLKSYITALGEPLLSDIKDFVVSSREEVIAERIRSASSYFMLLEYAGVISSPADKAYVRESAINLSVIIAHPGNKPGLDIIDEAIIMDKALYLAVQVAKQMDLDNQDLCGNKRYLPGTVSITPIEPVMLYNCIGWSVTFSKNEPLFNE